MELYRKTFKQLDEKHDRQMVAKAIRSFMSGSKKLRSVHISPITKEYCEGYNMEETHSGDRCIRLVFSTAYSANQKDKMLAEIKLLAIERLKESFKELDDGEALAFKECLEELAK